MSDDPIARPPMNRDALNRLDDEVARLNPRHAAREATPRTKAEPPAPTSELAKAMQRLEKTIAAQPKREPKPLAPTTTQVTQLPIWPEATRGAPNSFLRSALFGAIQGKGRRYLQKELLGSLPGVTIKFTGKQLDQSDLDVWEQAIHLARIQLLGHVCYFTGNSFLRALRRSNGKSDYEWLDDAITRLVACAVEIRIGSRVFTGSLLSSCARDETSGVYKLTLDPDTIHLYGSADWTGINWEQRQLLKGKPLALWLHGFYASHAAAFPLKVDTLRELSGSTNKDEYDFKRKLKAALADLKAVGAITDFEVADRVTVKYPPSPAQARHLIDKATGGRRKKLP